MKILLADDHALFRGGLAQVLLGLDDQVEIVETSNVDEILFQVKQQEGFDLILLDLNMPGKNGFDAIRLLSEKAPTIPIVIISASESNVDIKNSMSLGAMGFISKNTSPQVLLNALHLVLSGQVYFPQTAFNQNTSPVTKLTTRQIEVLHLMDEGLSNKLIASKLNISEATVKMHITAIFRQLNVSNRTQAVLKAQNLNLG